MAFDIYTEVTGKIVAMLEKGVVPWRSPILGQAKAGWPRNMESGKEYRGVNVFLLAVTAWCQGYSSACWMTYNQAKACGGNVKKGQKSSMVVFWKQYPTTDRKTGEPCVVPVLRYYNVFNVEQCEGIEIPDAVKFEPAPFTKNEACEQIVNGYEGRPEIEHAGCRAYYTPKMDAVTIPTPSRFASNEEYYGTLFHELEGRTNAIGTGTRWGRTLPGSGDRLILTTHQADALIVFRKFANPDREFGHGVHCAVFRNEGHFRSCSLIREAVEEWAWKRWPGERLYTYVGGQRIVATSPGHAFRCAGWRRCGLTFGGLIVMERVEESGCRPEGEGRAGC